MNPKDWHVLLEKTGALHPGKEGGFFGLPSRVCMVALIIRGASHVHSFILILMTTLEQSYLN